MSSGLPRVSVALCCLNEGANLPQVIERLKTLGARLGDRLHEIVIVDGGSTDGSWEALERLAAEWKLVKLLRQQPPRGYGSGYRQSVLACSGDVIATSDMDLNYDVTEVARMLPLLAEADLVIANPFLSGAEAWLGPSRMVLTHGVAWLYRFALIGRKGVGTVFTPILRVGRAEIVRGAVPQSNTFTASAEFMTRVYLLTDARVREVPVSVFHRGAGVSKLHKFRTAMGHVRWLRRVIAYRMKLRKAL